jgi:hypothetical protein
MSDFRDPRVFVFAPRPRSWLGRALYGALGLALLVLAFFFLTVALAAGALLALMLAARWWWIARKLRRAAAREVVEGEYTVVERAAAGETRLPPQR